MTLYKKVQQGNRVRYVEHVPEANPVPECSEFDNAELITLGVSLGVMMLMILEKQIPPHARNARKIKALENAILDLAKGHGAPITEEMTQYWVDVWNRVMFEVQAGLIKPGENQQ